MTVIVDTGVLLAAADADDEDHDRCAQLLRDYRGQLKVPAPVIPECAWQIERNLGPASEAGFLRLITTGQLEVVDLSIADYGHCADLIERYADLGLGLVDASVINVAENLTVTTLATLNRRDFTVIRPPPRNRVRTPPLNPLFFFFSRQPPTTSHHPVSAAWETIGGDRPRPELF